MEHSFIVHLEQKLKRRRDLKPWLKQVADSSDAACSQRKSCPSALQSRMSIQDSGVKSIGA